MRMYVFITIVIIMTIASSCEDVPTGPDKINDLKIYLESEYINYAWGYDDHGWFVDTSGNIISYDIAKSDARWIPNASGYYTEEEIWTKIHYNDTLRGSVPTDTMKILHDMAVASIGSSNSDTTCPARDMGSFIYSFYIYVPDSSKFRQFILRVDGDCRYYNTSVSAVALADWMSQR